MGLDMYIRGEKFLAGSHPLEKEDGKALVSKTFELGYWRKHPNLHGYIVNAFANGKDDCQKIDLSEEHLLEIIEAVEKKELPHTEGFFFGQSNGHEGERAQDLIALHAALDWLRTEEPGVIRNVYYRASW